MFIISLNGGGDKFIIFQIKGDYEQIANNRKFPSKEYVNVHQNIFFYAYSFPYCMAICQAVFSKVKLFLKILDTYTYILGETTP